MTKVEKPPGSIIKSGGNTHFKCNYCGRVFLGSYSRVKAHLLKITNKGIRACPKVTPSHRLEMQRMHDQIENDKLEREQRSQIPFPYLPQAVGLYLFSYFGDRKGVIVQIWLMVRGGR